MDGIRRILYVEDEPGLVCLVNDILETEGIIVEHAATYIEALAAIAGKEYNRKRFSGLAQYDALLLDVRFPYDEGGLPKVNGPQLARYVREELQYQGRIVMFSADDLEAAQTATYHLPNIRYLPKPPQDTGDILAALRRDPSGSELPAQKEETFTRA